MRSTREVYEDYGTMLLATLEAPTVEPIVVEAFACKVHGGPSYALYRKDARACGTADM